MEKKNLMAEKYRGLYNDEIDAVIDEINLKYKELLEVEEKIPHGFYIGSDKGFIEEEYENLRKFRIINKELDRLFQTLNIEIIKL